MYWTEPAMLERCTTFSAMSALNWSRCAGKNAAHMTMMHIPLAYLPVPLQMREPSRDGDGKGVGRGEPSRVADVGWGVSPVAVQMGQG